MGLVAAVSEKPLSTDPAAGITAASAPVPAGAHPEAKMSAAKPQRAFGQTEIAFPDRPSPEVTRSDSSLFGMPPEVAVLSGLSVGRAMGAAGLTAAERVVAGLKNAAGQAVPVLKYEAVKTGLQAVGFSPTLATAAAMAIAGYKGKGAAAEAPAAAEVAAPPAPKSTMQAALDDFLAKAEARRAAQAPVGATPAATAPVEATPAPIATPAPASPTPQAPPALDMAGQPAITAQPPVAPLKMSDRLNLFMREARKAGVTLSPNDYLALNKAVAAGTAPADAIGALLTERNPAAALAKLPGVMTDDEVRAALDARYAAGKIKTPSADAPRLR